MRSGGEDIRTGSHLITLLVLVLVLDKNPIRSRVIDHRFLAGCWATSCSDYTLTVPASGHIITLLQLSSFGEEKLLEFTFSESRSYFRRVVVGGRRRYLL